MRDEVLIAALAALLHDIGKFAQRAAEGHQIAWDEESDREFKYEHALYTDDVLSRLVPEKWRAAIRGPAGRHHRPQARLERVVALADRLSAGERSDAEEHHPKRLLSIFCRLQTDEPGPPPRYLPLRPLAMDEAVIFPTHKGEDEDSHRAYKALWDAFVRDATRLQAAHSGSESDLETYVTNLLLLLQRYTWCIPAAYYKTLPDVSLYDHSRTTAALAACLVEQDDATVTAMLKGEKQDVPVALLVGGDISGVQDFIYTITARGATSALRGRSFYLQLLTEAVYRYVLRQLELPITNLIYGGGGHFYLLAPPQAADRLHDIQRHVSRVLLHHHGGDLYLALGYVPLCPPDFRGQVLSQQWDEVTWQLRRAKAQRFSELGDEMYHQVFEPWRDQGNQEQECHVCGREHPGTREVAEETRKCPPCLSFEDLGEELRQARVLQLDEIPVAKTRPDSPPGRWDEVLAEFGLAVRLKEADKAAAGARRSVLLALKDDAVEELAPGPSVAVGRRFLVNVTPILTQADADWVRQHKPRLAQEQLSVGRVKPFSVLEVQSQGIERLGVLRMDVDNLGQLFSRGLGQAGTLSRVAALSFAMSLFFEGWVEALAQKHNREGGAETDRVYSIYSGGDDLFFVGSWDVMPRLALDIRNDFARFTAHHPGLHLSGGIALVGGKYPLYQAAADAGEAEEQAKSHPGKNAFTFLGQTEDWSTFANEVDLCKDKLCELVRSKRAPRALLRMLITLQLQYNREAEKRVEEGRDVGRTGRPQTYYGPWNWWAVYQLIRMEKRHKESKQDLAELRQLLGHENFTSIGWIGLAARWAELELRD